MFGFKKKNYTRKTIHCRRGKKRIYGEAWIPTGEGQFPLIIYCHGCGMDDSLFPHEKFVSQGIAVYAFDFCGGCPWSNSTGDPKDMSAMTQAEDLENVLDTMLQQDFVDSKRIYFMGFDLGGLAATMVAGKHVEEIAGLVLFAPNYVMPDFQKVFLGGLAVPETIRYQNMVVGARFVTDVQGYDIYGDMAAFDKPVLLYAGEDDEYIPLEYLDRAAKTFPNAEYHVIPVAGHVMTAGKEVEMIKAVVNLVLQKS